MHFRHIAASKFCFIKTENVEWPLVERDRARVGATIVCESRLVRGRRGGSGRCEGNGIKVYHHDSEGRCKQQ